MSWTKLLGDVMRAASSDRNEPGVGWDRSTLEAMTFDEEWMDERVASLGFEQTGNALKVAAIIPTDIDADSVEVRVLHYGEPVRTYVDAYSDREALFVLGRRLVGDTLFVDLPLHILDLKRDETVQITVVMELFLGSERVAHLAERTKVRIKYEPWSTVAWLAPAVDILAHYALRQGPWTAATLKRIQALFEGFGKLTEDDATALRDRLKLSVRSPLEECLATLMRRSRNEGLTSGLGLAVADLLRLSGGSQQEIEKELRTLREAFQKAS